MIWYLYILQNDYNNKSSQHPSSHSYNIFLVMRTFHIQSPSNSQIYDTVLPTVVTMLYIMAETEPRHWDWLRAHFSGRKGISSTRDSACTQRPLRYLLFGHGWWLVWMGRKTTPWNLMNLVPRAWLKVDCRRETHFWNFPSLWLLHSNWESKSAICVWVLGGIALLKCDSNVIRFLRLK